MQTYWGRVLVELWLKDEFHCFFFAEFMVESSHAYDVYHNQIRYRDDVIFCYEHSLPHSFLKAGSKNL